ncbi:TonB-dependent receptor [Desulfobulbus rhabdoformis]|uniref:TonB-dependent receptor n=1 Tax=Desulfobulbus rhabdoformis TaxID=34032 RepID=UPI0019662EF0|nr:TonB-dependent receptor [Desulfobulbus rhabdoformis]MBM9616739.1 TonB-dependent receptor [Desulfobulbus rhabdoformis]
MAVTGIFLESNDTQIVKDKVKATNTTKAHPDIGCDSIGIFSHLNYAITDRFSVLAGLRYDKVELEYRDAGNNLSIDSTENEVSPKVGITYALFDNINTYATISKGYRSGGFNNWKSDEYSQTYDPETLYSYEIGVKGVSFDGKLIWDTSLYYMDITDMQVDVYLDASTTYKTNAAEATSMGVEASLRYQVARGLNLFAGFSYNNTEFDEYNNGFTDYSGKKTTFSPEYNYNFGVQYRADQGYYASADISGYGDMYLDTDNEYKRPAYEVVNAKIGYEAENFDIYLYAKNLFDREYDIEGHYYGVYSYYSQPREIGMSLTYRF